MAQIVGYNKYTISKDGVVTRLGFRGGVLKPSLTGKGYVKYSLSKDGTVKTFLAHRLVAQAYLSNPNNLPQVNHKNGDKTDNRIENLEWVSAKDNQKHAHDTGLKQNGEELYNAKLKNHEAKEIITLHQLGFRQIELSRMYDVSRQTVWGVVHGRSYRRAS